MDSAEQEEGVGMEAERASAVCLRQRVRPANAPALSKKRLLFTRSHSLLAIDLYKYAL